MHAIGNVSLTSHRVSPRASFSPSDRSNFPRLIRARRFNGSRVLTSVTGLGTTGSSHAGKRDEAHSLITYIGIRRRYEKIVS